MEDQAITDPTADLDMVDRTVDLLTVRMDPMDHHRDLAVLVDATFLAVFYNSVCKLYLMYILYQLCIYLQLVIYFTSNYFNL